MKLEDVYADIHTFVCIDLNVRIDHDQTFSGFEDIYGDSCKEGDLVVAFESESKIAGLAVVTKMIDHNRIIKLLPWWRSFDEHTAFITKIMNKFEVFDYTA